LNFSTDKAQGVWTSYATCMTRVLTTFPNS
jgi:hypothetical protein